MKMYLLKFEIIGMENEIAVLYNILCLIDSDKINAEMYINGANQILKPLHDRIRKWISDNIVY